MVELGKIDQLRAKATRMMFGVSTVKNHGLLRSIGRNSMDNYNPLIMKTKTRDGKMDRLTLLIRG